MESPIDKDTQCICDDAFRLEECPVHPSLKEEAEKEYAKEGMKTVIVTAKHRVDPTSKTGWIGFAFKCDNCEEPSILEWFNNCPNCGSKINYEFSMER